MERHSLDREALAAVDSYVEYRRIVGEDDGGNLFTPEEYERYKKEVLPIRLQNRLFVSWTSPNGIDCKLVGPETLCFCRHRCKHYADDHDELAPYKCNKCAGCAEFRSSFTCGCGEPTYAHRMIVETKAERLARGRSVGPDVPFAAMGGLTGFNALAEGSMRLDSSGIDIIFVALHKSKREEKIHTGLLENDAVEQRNGGPSNEILDAPSTSLDHPFLRALVPQIDAINVGQPDDVYGLSRFAHLPTAEERDMAYFESRYQEQLKSEKAGKEQKTIPASKGETSQLAKPLKGSKK
ncbi:protein FAM221A isoform X4 [Narcine bancroftii]|uniref:protein FAM221A isoform X4 n=1 Tax=Narcine bancroftii TaxID=1343680 RepID=UPI0038312191